MKRRSRFFRWVPLALLLLAVSLALAEWRQWPKVLHALERVQPEWLALAVAFQAMTYLCVGVAYRRLAVALHAKLPWAEAARLSLVNLFVNNTLPSAGLSGNLFLVRMMSRRGVTAVRATAIVLLERTFYFGALVLATLLVLGRLLLWRGNLRPIEIFAAVVLIGLASAFALVTVRAVKGPVRAAERFGRLVGRAPRFLRRRLEGHDWVEDARKLEKAGGVSLLSPALIATCLLAEIGYLAADGLTLWALFRGVGSGISLASSLMGFTFAQLFAQALVVPGTLEVGMAGILTGFGARAATAVIVAILFHVLAFWAPMPLGWLFYRNVEARGAETPA